MCFCWFLQNVRFETKHLDIHYLHSTYAVYIHLSRRDQYMAFQWNPSANEFVPSSGAYDTVLQGHRHRAANLLQHWWLYKHWRRRRAKMAIVLQHHWKDRQQTRHARKQAACTIVYFWRRHRLTQGLLQVRDLFCSWQSTRIVCAHFRRWREMTRVHVRRTGSPFVLV